jgi:hypothetical protein
MQVSRQSAPHVGEVIEAMHVEQLFVQIRIEHFDLTVPLLVLGDDLIDAHFRDQLSEARDPAP